MLLGKEGDLLLFRPEGRRGSRQLRISEKGKKKGERFCIPIQGKEEFAPADLSRSGRGRGRGIFASSFSGKKRGEETVIPSPPPVEKGARNVLPLERGKKEERRLAH